MNEAQVIFEQLDISEQLRLLIATERLTVAQLAAAAGVSKSAMEKYLAGPSSPRATTVATLCVNLGITPEWLLFGHSDSDARRVRDFGIQLLMQLIIDMRRPGELRAAFEAVEPDSKALNQLAFDVACVRADELAARVNEARKRSMRESVEGHREAVGQMMPFQTERK